MSGTVAVHRSDRSSLGTKPCPSSCLLTDMHTHKLASAKVLTDALWDNSVTVFPSFLPHATVSVCFCGCVFGGPRACKKNQSALSYTRHLWVSGLKWQPLKAVHLWLKTNVKCTLSFWLHQRYVGTNIAIIIRMKNVRKSTVCHGLIFYFLYIQLGPT